MSGKPNARLANEAWESLLRAHTVMMLRFQTEDIWGDLSMREYDVLYTLAKAARPLRLGEIGAGVLLSQPALSRLVKRLVDRGLIMKAEDCSDKRALHLTLTDAGVAAQKKVGLSHARDVTRGLATLTEEELKQLQTLCTKLAGA